MTNLARAVARLCGLLALALGLLFVPAATEKALAAATEAASTSAYAIAPATDAWCAALPHDPDAATQAYLDRVSPQARARSDAYFEGGYWLQLWNLLFGLLVAWRCCKPGPPRPHAVGAPASANGASCG